MMLQMLPIYGCAVLTVATLFLFGRQNRKSGWKRERATFLETVNGIYQEFGSTQEAAQPAAAAIPALPVLTSDQAFGFSAQLLRMRSALGSSAPAPALSGVEAEAHALVAR